MQGKEHLVEQHIREYESRQRHIEELMEKAKAVAEEPHHVEDLTVLSGSHEEHVVNVEKLKQGHHDEDTVQAIEDAGPMGIWYGLISELEAFIERAEK